MTSLPNAASASLVRAAITPPDRRKLNVRGGIGTAAYLICWIVYAWAVWPNILAMKPNELADCLAGAFAPLAFLWLVLGFLQQGQELQHSAAALYLQSEELRNSVEQQRRLADVSQEQLSEERTNRLAAEKELTRQNQPRLRLTGGSSMSSGDGVRLYNYELINVGPPCTDAVVSCPALPSVRRSPLVDTDRPLKFALELAVGSVVEDIPVHVDYLDVRGFVGRASFRIPGNENGSPGSPSPA